MAMRKWNASHASGDGDKNEIDDSLLATQLRQVWLENHGYPFLSEGAGWQLETALQVDEMEDDDPLKDPVLNYISDLMEEEVTDRTCMFIDCSSYQAMAKELTDLITDSLDSSLSEEDSSHNTKAPSETATDRKALPHSVFDGKFSVLESPPSLDSSTSSSVCNEKFSLPPERELQCASAQKEESPDEILRFFQEKVADQECECVNSSQPQPRDGSLDDCAHKMLELYPCLEPGFALCQGRKGLIKEDPCSEALCLGWDDDTMECTRRSSAAVNSETPEELANRLSHEKENMRVISDMLVDCAKAVAADSITEAYKLVNKARERVSAYGDSGQRIGHQFVEALAARITGTGGLLYTAMSNNRPSTAEMLKAYYVFACHHPFVKMTHFFCNQSILDVATNAKRLHIVDFGVLYGFQWPCLIKALGSKAEGPPHLRMTGIDFPQPGFMPAERVQETGRRLAAFAKAWGVPFEYQALATNWENVQPSSLSLRHDEVLVVNCAFRLRHLLDETVKAESPRKVVLSRIRSMNPKLFILGVLNGCYNSPFFVNRFCEALSFYSFLFEALDASISRDDSERLLIEQQMLGREILNIVACEGVERVERAESYMQWESRTKKAGFEQIPLNPEIHNRCRAMLNTFHKDHGVGRDGKWLLLGWKNRVLKALSTWQPRT